eukprot:2066652-Amphidinium_carterae.2
MMHFFAIRGVHSWQSNGSNPAKAIKDLSSTIFSTTWIEYTYIERVSRKLLVSTRVFISSRKLIPVRQPAV